MNSREFSWYDLFDHAPAQQPVGYEFDKFIDPSLINITVYLLYLISAWDLFRKTDF